MTGVSRVAEDDRADFRLLGQALDGQPALSPEEWRKSRRALVALVRERLGLMPETPELPDGQFACIVADPPWKLDTGPDVFGGFAFVRQRPLQSPRVIFRSRLHNTGDSYRCPSYTPAAWARARHTPGWHPL